MSTLARCLLAYFLVGTASQLFAQATPVIPDATVGADGSAAFLTVQSAIDAAPTGGTHRYVIAIKPGIYREKIIIPPGKGPIVLKGTDATKTRLTWGDFASEIGPDGKAVGTFESFSVRISSPDFEADDLSFENDHGPGSQALAVRVEGDRAIFRRCQFKGYQDTILTNGNRQYFEDCGIWGAVDFIFGPSTCFFDHCQLHPTGHGYLTAASTPQTTQYGYVFSHCQVAADPSVKPGSVLLGRPWRPFAAVAFLHCDLDASINPVGWFNWKDPAREKTARYREYQNTGPGAPITARVAWSAQLTPAEAANYTIAHVIGGTDKWNPEQKPPAPPVKP